MTEMIYCVEDDAGIRELELYALKTAGFSSKGFSDGASFWKAMEKTEARPSLVLLDIMLPVEDGISILKRLRNNPATKDIAVIMTTAKGAEYDKVIGLDSGADDYLAKPFGMLEMIARVKAVLRRSEPVADGALAREKHFGNGRSSAGANGNGGFGNGAAGGFSGNGAASGFSAADAAGGAGGNHSTGASAYDATLTVKSIVLDKLQHVVTVKDKEISLTVKEFDILQLFMENPNRVFSRDQLLSIIWGEEYLGESRTVDMHISTLRTKLGKQGKRIKTLRGVGYRLEDKSK